jgi:hypothetical protein
MSMPWFKAKKAYVCSRCRERIKKGDVYFCGSVGKKGRNGKVYPSPLKTYRYHMECKSLSGRKEASLTKSLDAFIRSVGKGPKMTQEIPILPALVNICYRKAVMMGLPVYKHIFYSHRTKEVIFFMQKHEKECLRRVKRLGKPNREFHRQQGSILGPRKK